MTPKDKRPRMHGNESPGPVELARVAQKAVALAQQGKSTAQAEDDPALDVALLADLPAGIDPCGEKGEFHSCVVAGPMFDRRIEVVVGETVERDGFAYTDLAPQHTTRAA